MTYTTEEQQQISQIIIEQMGGFGRLEAMIAAKNFMTTDDPVGLRFQFSGSKKANICKITLLASDTYKFELFKYTRVKYAHCPVVYEVEGVYDDMLKSVFEQETGLYLTL